MSQRTLREVRYGSGDPRGGPVRVEGLSGRFVTGRGTLGEARDGLGSLEEVWDGSRDLRGRPLLVAGPLGRFETGLRILGEVCYGF